MTRETRTPDEILSQETKNLIDHKNDMRTIYASHLGNGNNKRLYIDGNGNFIVEHKGVDVLTTIQASLAVRKYFLDL